MAVNGKHGLQKTRGFKRKEPSPCKDRDQQRRDVPRDGWFALQKTLCHHCETGRVARSPGSPRRTPVHWVTQPQSNKKRKLKLPRAGTADGTMVDVCRSCEAPCLCAPGAEPRGQPPFSPLFHKVRSKKSVECFVTARMAFAETPPGTAAWRVWQLEAAEHVATVAVEVERDALTVWCGPFDLAAPDAAPCLLEAFACLAAPDQTAPVVRELSGAQCLAFLAGVRAQCDPATTRVVDGVVDGVEVVVRGLGSDSLYAPNLLKRRKNR